MRDILHRIEICPEKSLGNIWQTLPGSYLIDALYFIDHLGCEVPVATTCDALQAAEANDCGFIVGLLPINMLKDLGDRERSLLRVASLPRRR